MGDFNEYDYLEATLEDGKERNGDKGRTDDDKRKRHREDDSREERKSSRPRSRTRSPRKERERERGSYRDRRDYGGKRKKSPEPEPEVDPERDQRTVFAYQISLKADERDLYEFFSRAGKVRDIRLIVDRNSRRHKGVGYIEFYDVMSVPMAIALSGQLIKNVPVMVKPSEAEKNLVQPSGAVNMIGAGVGAFTGGQRRLYVGNLHFNMTEEQLKQVFEPFGPVELVQLPLDPETNQCKGFGFVQYINLADAQIAMQNLNGLELAGRAIKVAPVAEGAGAGDGAGEIDDDDGGGLALNARSRALLMQKLDRTGMAAVVPPPAPLTGIPLMGAPIPHAQKPIGLPSQYLLLENMFDPAKETEPDWDLDIADDTKEECSKYGAVKHIFVDKNSMGHVYLKFDATTSAQNAQKALHGRWFAGKQISATFLVPLNYVTRFPEAVNV
eukprot:TRINITY_DN6488_c0_g2_i3.p1 TRINITY_DN6488_c0_g2~~TRINITY_DN6488_c0_g2_i3.p1  ORF type:complete len:442 (-),score=89.84 TRINITY_DN6488_c0_g2_i3:453-1778(-)